MTREKSTWHWMLGCVIQSVDRVTSVGVVSVFAAALVFVAPMPVTAGTATMAISNTQAPGTPAGITFSQFSGPALNDGGQVAFRASVAGAGVSGTNDFGIWRGAAGDIVIAAREGSTSPGTSAGVLFSTLQLPVLNNAGQVAFESGLYRHWDHDVQ